MQDFDSLKNIWQQSAPAGPAAALPSLAVSKQATGIKKKLQRQQLAGGISLVLTAALIALMTLMELFSFEHWYTYAALFMVIAICILQALLLFFTYKKIAAINVTALPAMHLQQWEAYYAFRKNQLRWNMPVYYFFLNLAMGIYFIEIFQGRHLLNILIFLAVYIAWMLFSWFYLGKKTLKKENDRLQQIMSELSAIERQLTTSE